MGRTDRGQILVSEEREAGTGGGTPPIRRDRPVGLDPETCRRAQAVAIRQLHARIAAIY